ncbi:MAG: lysophospholipid acyltransferase family protein [Kofleriaceae bacterium]
MIGRFDEFGLAKSAVARATAISGVFHDYYFRVEAEGREHVPATGSAILVANHGGMLPIDAAMLWADVARAHRTLRPIADHFVAALPFVGTWFARAGMVTGTKANVRVLIERGELLAIWPEGTSGPAKPFRERYAIQRWTVGFAELALRFRVPVIPVGIVGSEECWPILAKLPIRAFGSPYLPIPAVPLPLPVRFHVRYGTPLELLGDPDDPRAIARAAESTQIQVENLLADLRRERKGWWR